MQRQRRIIAILLLCISSFTTAGALLAQESESDSDSRLSVVIFQPWNLVRNNDSTAGEDVPADYERIIYDIVTNEVRGGGYRIIEAEPWDQYFAGGQEGDVYGSLPHTIAAEGGGDLALSIFYKIEPNRVFLMVRVYDIRGGRIIAGNVQIARSGLSLLNSMNVLMARILPQIADAEEQLIFMKENPGLRIGTSAATVIFTSRDEGMQLGIPGVGGIGEILDGSLQLPYQPLALGQELEIEKNLQGYYSETESFALYDLVNTIELAPLYPKTRIATEFSYNAQNLAGLGMAIRAYISPDQSYLRLYNQIYLNPPRADAPPGAKTYVHDDVLLEFGSYLIFGHESVFRLAYSAGVGVLITPIVKGITAADLYLNLAALNFELNFKKMSLMLRGDLRYFLPAFPVHLHSQGLGDLPKMLPTTVGVMIKW